MNGSDLLKQLLKTEDEQYSTVCKVTAVNGSLCDCKPIDDNYPEIPDVRLQSEEKKGFLIIPKIGSVVIITWLNATNAYVAMFSEVESIQLNGDNYSGLVKADTLKEELDKTNDAVQKLIDLFTNWAPVAQDGGAALKTLASSTLAGIELGDYSDIKNSTVSHGNGS